MEYEKLKTIPRFANVASEEDAIAGITAMASENEALLAEKQALQAENDALKARIQAAEDKQVEDILTSAVADGKIAESQKDTYRNLLKADRESAQKVLNSLKKARSIADDIDPSKEDNASGAWEKRQQEIRNSLK